MNTSFSRAADTIAPENCVSVLIACHNSEPWIARAVSSALAQPEASEVIVVDDASSDRSVAVALAADDGSNRLMVVCQPINKGPAAARNRALDLASSHWVSLLDADDFFLEGRLAGLMRHADQADFIADDPLRLQAGRMDAQPRSVLGVRRARWITFQDFVTGNRSSALAANREWGYLQPMIRRQFLRDHQLRHREEMRLGEDYELYARALAHGARFLVLPSLGYVCVKHHDSLSSRHGIDDLRLLRDCDLQLAALAGLSLQDKLALKRHSESIAARLYWRLLLNAIRARDLKQAISCIQQPWPMPVRLCLLAAIRLQQRASERLLSLLP